MARVLLTEKVIIVSEKLMTASTVGVSRSSQVVISPQQLWVAAVTAFASIGLVFGTATFVVFISGIGVFYGPGWVGLCFLVGFPASATALFSSFVFRTNRFSSFIKIVSGVGLVLSSIGAWNVLYTMLHLL